MRTKKMMALFLSTILLTIIALLLCSCDLFGGGSKNEKSADKGKTTTPADEGWETVDSPNVYQTLILGCTNVAYQGSKKVVTSNNGVLTIDSQMKISLSETSLWLTIKAKYKSDNPRKNTMATIELSTDETPSADSRIVSLNVYNDEIYVALGNDDKNMPSGRSNKVKFSLANAAWENYFPYDMVKLEPGDISNLAALFVASVVTNSQVKAEYRHSTQGDEYRYNLDIDLDETLSRVFTSNLLKSSNAGDSLSIIKDLEKFIAVFYGVDEADISGGNLPASTLIVNFQTLNNTISSMSLAFDVDLRGKTQLFSGGNMKGTASINKLSIGSDYGSLRIPFVSDTEEMAKYVAFNDTIFSIRFPLDEFKDGNTPTKTMLKITTKIFQGEGERDFMFAEYSDALTGDILHALYIYSNVIYFYTRTDGDLSCFASMEIDDLGTLATKLLRNELGGNSKFYPTKLLAYIINGLSIDNTGIKFSIKPNFYSDVWYNFDDFCSYINSFTAAEMMDNEGIQFFYNYVTTNEVIVTMGTHDPFFEVLSSSDSDVTAIISMLSGVSTDTRLAPAE